jgi:hypothetical protein
MSLGGASSTGSLGCEAPVSGVGPRPAEAGIDRGLVPGAKANARAWLVAGEGIAVGRIGVPCRLPDIHQVRGTAALGTGRHRILYLFPAGVALSDDCQAPAAERARMCLSAVRGCQVSFSLLTAGVAISGLLRGLARLGQTLLVKDVSDTAAVGHGSDSDLTGLSREIDSPPFPGKPEASILRGLSGILWHALTQTIISVRSDGHQTRRYHRESVR